MGRGPSNEEVIRECYRRLKERFNPLLEILIITEEQKRGLDDHYNVILAMKEYLFLSSMYHEIKERARVGQLVESGDLKSP